MSILKPICGLDSDTYENFASFCLQDYPKYQIIFAVRDQGDDSIKVVKQIIRDFPHIDISLVSSDRLIGANLKVSNLANAITKAKHSILVLADSDIRVGRDYLQRIIQPFQDQNVGVVTCLYRSLTKGWVAIIESLGIATDFQAGVLVSQKLEGIKFALGSTIVIRQSVLTAIGGFPAIADYLADDFQLGYLPAQAGYKVVLSDYIVDHAIANDNVFDFLQRQTRWDCCMRVSRPWGYVGLIFTYGTVSSLLFLIASSGNIWGWTILGITWIMRLIMAYVVGVKSLKDETAKNFLWLVPVIDLLNFGLWCYSFIGDTIQWRGQKFRLTKEGKLIVINTDTAIELIPNQDSVN